MPPIDDDWEDVYKEETMSDTWHQGIYLHDIDEENEDDERPICPIEEDILERLAWEKHIEQRLNEGYTYEQIQHEIKKLKGEIPNNPDPSPVDRATGKQKEIVNWLSNSRYAIKFNRNNGFYVLKGSIVRLKNGDSVEILNWLSSEGIVQGKIIGGYRIKQTHPGGKHAEKLSFFHITRKL